MNARSVDEIAQHVVAYCEAIEIPAFDEAAFAALHRVPVGQSAPRGARWKLATSAVAIVVLLVALSNLHAVVAGVQQLLRAFTIDGGARTSMTIRAVDLRGARADMPFEVIAPPHIAGVPIVTVDEVAAGSSDPSVIFELHGTSFGPEVMIVESNAAAHHAPTLFTIGGSANATGSAALPALKSRVRSKVQTPRIVLRGFVDDRGFLPATWVAHGTRVVVMSPPGFLSVAQLRAIRHAMTLGAAARRQCSPACLVPCARKTRGRHE